MPKPIQVLKVSGCSDQGYGHRIRMTQQRINSVRKPGIKRSVIQQSEWQHYCLVQQTATLVVSHWWQMSLHHTEPELKQLWLQKLSLCPLSAVMRSYLIISTGSIAESRCSLRWRILCLFLYNKRKPKSCIPVNASTALTVIWVIWMPLADCSVTEAYFMNETMLSHVK